MEYQFPKESVDYLKQVLYSSKNEEQTQEVKLSDAMPDIGKVICAWGQPLVRSKEWRGSTVGISGGVMAWVVYMPETGGEPKCVESWIPFQTRWEIPQSKRDGTIRTQLMLCDMDARSISARKLMLRTVVCAVAEAVEPAQVMVFQPQQIPEDIQVLKKTYPVMLLKEAGERTAALEEEITIPVSLGASAKLTSCTLRPLVTEKRVTGDKLVFRGSARLCCAWLCDDGRIRSNAYELPFSQYAELSGGYGPQAVADVVIAVTNMEPELQEDGHLRLKAGMVGQYLVWDTTEVQVVEDAYSTERPVATKQQLLELPTLLDICQENVRAEHIREPDAGELAVGELWIQKPQVGTEDSGTRVDLSGMFQLLTYPDNGDVQCTQPRWEGGVSLTGDSDNVASVRISSVGNIRTAHGSGNMAVCDVAMDVFTGTILRVNMVTALEAGETVERDPGRPSLILMRADKQELWEIAKSCGSTIQAIAEANSLTDEPLPGQMLLIPVR